ncbi:MAG: metallophosphoesterase family protein [Paludibacteraceae bacterium]|nr:metallophosphoesterase family protein [Paludibacteraceae bacterium]
MKKRIVWLVILLLVLAGTITLCVIRWDAWFANPAEPVYTVGDEPTNVVLTFGEQAATGRVVSWRAGKDTTTVSRLILTHVLTEHTDTIPAQSHFVSSRSGEAAFHQVHLMDLHPGDYTYRVETDGLESQEFHFTVQAYSDTCPQDTFLLFGDMQYTSLDEASAFVETACNTVPEADFFAYIGDIIERPTDEYWQLFFSSMGDKTACFPQVATLGNHEYLKGIRKRVDVRWPHIFVNPKNGPKRFLGRTYFLDFPNMRLIVLDTDALQSLSDYTVLRTWLTQVLRYESTQWNQTAQENLRWNIVLMHHPVFSAGMGRDNPLIAWALRYALQDADLVVAGHDHNYARHRHDGEAPAYVILSSSAKSYLPKCSPIEERLGSNHAFFSRMIVTPDTMKMSTFLVDSVPVLYDELFFVRKSTEEGVVVLEADSLPEERLDLPARYEGRNNLRVRRFLNRRNARFEQQN